MGVDSMPGRRSAAASCLVATRRGIRNPNSYTTGLEFILPNGDTMTSLRNLKYLVYKSPFRFFLIKVALIKESTAPLG